MPVRRLVALSAAVAALLVALLVTALPASAAKEYRAERFHVRVLIEPGGSIVVTETTRFVFSEGSFTYATRDIPRRRTDGIQILDAAMDGVALTRGKQPGQYEVRREDNGTRRVVWHFAPVTRAAHEFSVTYRAAGVAWQAADSDVLAWTLLPTKHSYLIECASAEVEYPASSMLLGTAVVDPPATSSLLDGRTLRVERCPFERDQSWVVTLRFEPRTLAAAPPAWQAKSQRGRENLPLFLGLAGFILIGGAGLFLWFGLSHRPVAASGHDLRQDVPPDSLPPALAGALLRPGASAGWGDLLGALLDLARRGAIRIEAQPGSGLFKQDDARLVRGETPPALLAHERTLLDLVFTGRSGPRSTVKFSELARTFASARRWKLLRGAVTEDLRAAGLLDPERERARGRVVVLAVAVLVLAFVGFAVSAALIDRVGDPVLALPAAAMLAGIVGVIAGTTLSPLSDAAQSRASRWKAYRRHLADGAGLTSGAPEGAAVFERLLPYAAAFGVALSWAKRLQKQGLTAGPSWLAAVTRDGRTSPADMASTIAVLSSGSRAGAHAGGSAAGGAGAAGGGASSAG